MSWNITVAGSPEHCQQSVRDESNIPGYVKEALLQTIGAQPCGIRADGRIMGVLINSVGHVDNYSGHVHIEVKLIEVGRQVTVPVLSDS